ncbi:glutathione S-transferase 1-like [Amphiura filiformis]|uniref:glutathione S-transferase 1-like n=1 Tax=Amphiura filiformis TaxID=82378 RepID=UPI003B20D9AC
MASYKLTYFNGRGRVETARTLFKLAGVAFEDHRIEMKDWPEYKPKTPFGSLPVLDIDGRIIVQSKAIFRYLARGFGFYGESNWDCAQIDSIVDMLDEFYYPKMFVILTGSGEEKEKAVAEFTETATKVLGDLEKILSENDGGDGYFVGKRYN